MFSKYDGTSPYQRLRDIAERFDLIDEFLATHTRETFLQDVKTRLAIVRLVEEICEAAYWFVKHAKGAEFRDRYPEIDFGAFGGLGNIYRHQYALVDYGTVWDDIHGADMTALRIVARAKAAE